MARTKKTPTAFPQWAADEINASELRDEFAVVVGYVEETKVNDALVHLGLIAKQGNIACEMSKQGIKDSERDETIIRSLREVVDLLQGHLARLNAVVQDDEVAYDLRKIDYIKSTRTVDAYYEALALITE